MINPFLFFLHLAHFRIIGGRIKIDVKNAYRIVKHIITPNCCSGGIGAKISMPNPEIVLIAAINKALPVCPMVSLIAFTGSPVLSATSLNLWVACIA